MMAIQDGKKLPSYRHTLVLPWSNLVPCPMVEHFNQMGNMGPTSVGGCPWLIYALQGKLNNSCELVSCLRQGLYLVSIK